MATNNFRYSVTGKVTATERVGTSRNGNPTYNVTVTDLDGVPLPYRTSSDSGLAYGITNPEYRDNVHEFGISKAGRLNGYVRESGHTVAYSVELSSHDMEAFEAALARLGGTVVDVVHT